MCAREMDSGDWMFWGYWDDYCSCLSLRLIIPAVKSDTRSLFAHSQYIKISGETPAAYVKFFV